MKLWSNSNPLPVTGDVNDPFPSHDIYRFLHK